MGGSNSKEKSSEISQAVSTSASSGSEKKLKPCCACPETKRARDACIVENGEENCTDLIEAHKKCMRDHGFNI